MTVSCVRVPKYRLHKGSGQAIVQIDGCRHYLGKHGTEESMARCSGPPTFGSGQIGTKCRADTRDEVPEAPREWA